SWPVPVTCTSFTVAAVPLRVAWPEGMQTTSLVPGTALVDHSPAVFQFALLPFQVAVQAAALAFGAARKAKATAASNSSASRIERRCSVICCPLSALSRLPRKRPGGVLDVGAP